MCSLFDPSILVTATFVTNTKPDLCVRDTLLVGKRLWAAFTAETGSNKLCLSISSHRRKPKVPSLSPPTLLSWAVLDGETEELAIPPDWPRLHPHLFSPSYPGGQSVDVRVGNLALLRTVILTALSAEAYQIAGEGDSCIENWLCGDIILRQGSIYTFTSNSLPVNGHVASARTRLYQYRLDMLEPVLQGYAKRGETSFVVMLHDGGAYSSGTSEPHVAEDSEDDEDALEIDESFLAGSISTFRYPSSTIPLPPRPSPATINGKSEFFFRPVDLSEPIAPLHEDYTLHLRTADLSRIGILNGDWAIARASDSLKRRLVRIFACDDLPGQGETILGPPALLCNITATHSPSLSPEIGIQCSPFGSGQPAIPTARTVTIARVAGPSSTDRKYQTLFLRSLKSYFAGTKRLVKEGDLIAVGIDTDAIQSIDSAHDDTDAPNLELLGSRYSATSSRINEAIFFVVTNLEHEVVNNSVIPSSEDNYLGSTVGELGCWIDSAITRVIQTGLEHSRIPDVVAYMGLDCRGPDVALAPVSDSPLFSSESPFGKLVSLCSAALAQSAANYKLQLSVLLKGARGTGKFTCARWVARCLNMNMLEVNCYDIIGENDTQTEATLISRFDKAGDCSPCILVLRHIDALAQTTQVLETGQEPVIASALAECIDKMQENWKLTGYPVIVLGTTSQSSRVPIGVLSSFKHEVPFEAPGEFERREILNTLVSDMTLAPDVELSSLAIKTAALVAADLVDFVKRAEFISVERACLISRGLEADMVLAGVPVTAADFETALGKARMAYSESIGAPTIPSVSWDDVGGLTSVKSDILDTIQLPLDHPELFADGLKKRSGILLYGPPGTGKTLLAKAVATSCSLNFFSVKGPELLNMYIGESEANVRRVFQRARDAKPCVIFFDELDSVAPKRGNHGDSGGVMDRIVSQLLAELDGISGGSAGADVFVIGATNRPDLLDPALLRPGRFDRMLYLGVSDTHESQLNILHALTRKFRLDPSLDLSRVADRCPFNYTGADFYALCSDAMLNAMSRKAEALEAKLVGLNSVPGPYKHPHPLTPQYFLAEMATAEDTDVLVCQQDFESAIHDLVPSVSQSEMEHYRHVQHRFSGQLDGEESKM